MTCIFLKNLRETERDRGLKYLVDGLASMSLLNAGRSFPRRFDRFRYSIGIRACYGENYSHSEIKEQDRLGTVDPRSANVLRDLIQRNFHEGFIFGIQRRRRFILARIIGSAFRKHCVDRESGLGWQPGKFCKKLIHHLRLIISALPGQWIRKAGRTVAWEFSAPFTERREGRESERDRDERETKKKEGWKKRSRYWRRCRGWRGLVEPRINCSYLGPPPSPPHRWRYRICN